MTSIVLVHTGRRRAPTLRAAIRQLRTYLPSSQIYLLTDRPKQGWEPQSGVERVDTHDLARSQALEELQTTTRLPTKFRDSFWLRVMSRHFLMAEFIKDMADTDWLHFENDCLSLITPKILQQIKDANEGVAVPFESKARAIPVVVHIKNKASATRLASLLLKTSIAHPDLLDMDVWAAAAASMPDLFTPLPTLLNQTWAHPCAPPLPAESHDFVPADWQWTNSPKFSALFDAAALGQFLAGPDPHNQGFKRTPGFVNPTSWLKVDHLAWRLKLNNETDLPRIEVQFKESPWVELANLHMHSKKMHALSTDSKFWNDLIDTANKHHVVSSSFAYDLIGNSIFDQPRQAPRMLADLAYNWIHRTRR